MSRQKSMDQTGEERHSNWLVHSDQSSFVKKALDGVSILYAKSSAVQGQFCVVCFFSKGKDQSLCMCVCMYVCVCIYTLKTFCIFKSPRK